MCCALLVTISNIAEVMAGSISWTTRSFAVTRAWFLLGSPESSYQRADDEDFLTRELHDQGRSQVTRTVKLLNGCMNYLKKAREREP